jgi:hypothetical protein
LKPTHLDESVINAERRQAMSYSISTLLTCNLQDVFGENDPARRRAAIDEIWTEDGVFYDPKTGVHRGRDEIDRVAGAIRATHPARVETLGELDAALKAARESKSGAYIEVIGGRMDMPKGLAFAHTRLKELYGDTP